MIGFVNNQDKPVAYCVNYALKTCAIDNSMMEENERLISSDVAGYACQSIENKYKVPVLFLMSAAANQVPRQTAFYDYVHEDGQVETIDKGIDYGMKIVDDLGKELAKDIENTINKIKLNQCDSRVKVSRTSFAWQGVQRYEKKPRTSFEYPLSDQYRDIDVSIMTFDQYAFVFGKPEFNQPTQKEILAHSPFKHTYLVTMTNGGFKYIPDQKAYDEITWEAQSSFVKKGAAEEFVTQAIKLLKAA